MFISFDPTKHVPDINHWEGVIDFDAYELGGARTVITKLTDGRNFGDPLAGYALRHAKERGMKREVYHFLRPLEDMIEQMRVFKAALYGAYFDPITEPVELDVEDVPLRLRLRRLFRPIVLHAFRTCYLMLGVMPGCYTRMSLWNPYVGPVDWRAEGLPQPRLHAADYGYNGEGSGITGPRWIDRVSFPDGWQRWQFTDRGRVPGVTGACDLNIDRGV